MEEKGRIHSLAEKEPGGGLILHGENLPSIKKVAGAGDTDQIKALYLSPSLNINDCPCL